MTTQQPEAIQLAEALDAIGRPGGLCGAAAELRRLHAENEALKQQIAPAGWKLVPVEPTEEMIHAAYDALEKHPFEGNIRRHYRAMLAAAPAPEAAADARAVEVILSRDHDGMCTVTLNGVEVIRDNGDIISHVVNLPAVRVAPGQPVSNADDLPAQSTVKESLSVVNHQLITDERCDRLANKIRSMTDITPALFGEEGYCVVWDLSTVEERRAAIREILGQPVTLEPMGHPQKLWLWKNFVDGKPEYWAFDNPFPVGMDCDDPQTLGEPCGYALFKPSRPGRTDVTEEQVLRRLIDAAKVKT